MSDGSVAGELILSSTATTNISGPAQIFGGTVTDDALLTGAVTCAKQRSTLYAGKPASPGTPTVINISNPSGNVTINGDSGLTVVNLTDLVLNGGATLTLVAKDTTTKFLINDTGRFVIQGGSHIVALKLGSNNYRVLYNILGPGQDVAMGGGLHNQMPNSTVGGIILAPDRNIDLSPGFVAPEIIGGGKQISITSGGIVRNFN
jgi:hypothetical protein